MQKIVAWFTCLILWSPFSARAADIYLKNGERVAGDIEHAYHGLFSIRLSTGSTRTIGENEIARIEWSDGPRPERQSPKIPPVENQEANLLQKLTKENSKFGEPLATFETWRKAAIAGDLDSIVECYASFRQKEVKSELKKLKKDAFRDMQATTAQTDFVPAQPLYQGDRAVLEVAWTKGLVSDRQVLQFVLEGNDWKLIQ